MENPESILTFWFGTDEDDAKVAQQKTRLWWSKDAELDLAIAGRFAACTAAAANGELDAWAATPRGLLALILLTDQFPRSMYRDLPKAFAFDALALRWSLQGLEAGMDLQLRAIERVFFYLPLEHAESIEHQEHAVILFDRLLQQVPPSQQEIFAGFRQFAIRHRDIIARFGRFPHRNAIFERAATDEERIFLQTPGSGF